MNAKVQIIEKDGEPEYAVLPYPEYMRLLEICEEAEDVRVFDEAMEAIRQGEELVPAEVVNRLIEGENPVKVWREQRGMSQAALARAAGIKAAYLSQLEMGARKGSVTVLCALASTLKVDVEALISAR